LQETITRRSSSRAHTGGGGGAGIVELGSAGQRTLAGAERAELEPELNALD
jgi:hypothetical protein